MSDGVNGGDGSGPAPGWYPNPENATQQRYWDGAKWTDQTQPLPGHTLPPPPTPIQSPISYAGHAPSQPKAGTPTWVKVMLGVVLAVVVMIAGCAGCAALFTGAAVEGINELEKEHQKAAITMQQVNSVELGTPKSEVIATLGKPDDTQQHEDEHFGKTSCIYYPVKGGEFLDDWQFCFDAQNKLESKNRW